MSVVRQDTFTRADQAGWGTASDGSAWTIQSGNGQSILSNEGHISGSTASTFATLGAALSGADAEGLVRFMVGDNTHNTAGIILRWTDANNHWLGRFNGAAGSINVMVKVGGVYTSQANFAVAVSLGTQYWLRFRCEGTTISLKFWQDGTAEPGTWTQQFTGLSSQNVAGMVGLYGYSNGTSGVDVDSFSVDDLVYSGPVVAQDSFSRANVASGWGTATDGKTWANGTPSGGSPLSVSANEGVCSGNGSARNLMTLGTLSNTDGEVLYRFSTNPLTGQGDVYALCRYQDTSNYYWAGAQWVNSGSFSLSIRKRVGGANTTITSTPITVAAGTFYWVRAQVQGSTLNAKFWVDGSAEPASWTLSTTDTALTAGAGWGLAPYTATNETVQVDHFTVYDLTTGGTTQNASAAFSGGASSTLSASLTAAGGAAASGAGLSVVTAQALLNAGAAFAGVGGAALGPLVTYNAAAAFSGHGDATLNVNNPVFASAAASGGGAATLGAVARLLGAAAFAGSGLAALDAQALRNALASASGAGDATLAAAAVYSVLLTASGSGRANLNPNAFSPSGLPPTALAALLAALSATVGFTASPTAAVALETAPDSTAALK